jgi:Arc/MetJ-type ribon-helix-helix transcriptional regulator
MKMVRLNIQLPQSLKAKLDALRSQGTTASGFIRRLLEDDFRLREEAREGREDLPEFQNLTPWKPSRQRGGQSKKGR